MGERAMDVTTLCAVAGMFLACGGQGAVEDTDLTTEAQASIAATDEPECGKARPSWNTGQGFFVVKNKIYDANGVEFKIRGVNHTHWWGGTGEAAIP